MKFYQPTMKSQAMVYSTGSLRSNTEQYVTTTIVKDSLTLRFFKRLGLKVDPIKKFVSKFWRVYVLGRVDPVTIITHNSSSNSILPSFSGIDVRVYFQESGCEKKELFGAQAISWAVNEEGVRGTLINAVFNESLLNILPKNPFSFILQMKNEYGYSVEIKIENVKPISLGSGLSIDDIVWEEQMIWEATSLTFLSQKG